MSAKTSRACSSAAIARAGAGRSSAWTDSATSCIVSTSAARCSAAPRVSVAPTPARATSARSSATSTAPARSQTRKPSSMSSTCGSVLGRDHLGGLVGNSSAMPYHIKQLARSQEDGGHVVEIGEAGRREGVHRPKMLKPPTPDRSSAVWHVHRSASPPSARVGRRGQPGADAPGGLRVSSLIAA